MSTCSLLRELSAAIHAALARHGLRPHPLPLRPFARNLRRKSALD